MELSELTARELTRIDSICLDFERQLRAGDEVSIDVVVAELGGQQGELLRRELEAVQAEIRRLAEQPAAKEPFTPSARFSGVARTAETIEVDGQGRTPGTSSSAVDAADRKPSSAVRVGNVIQLPEAGDMIGPYQVGKVLGRGGMGAVYHAIDTRLDRVVAIKVLAIGGSRRAELSERFEREAKAVAALSHPNIVELFDVGSTAGLPYAVMEFLDGETLQDRCARSPLRLAEVRRIGAQISDALAAAHAGAVIHRDLKPNNIMLVRRHGADSVDGDEPAREQFVRDLDKNGKHDQTTSTPTAVERDGGPRSGVNRAGVIVKLFDFGLSRAPRSGFADSQITVEETRDDGQTRAGIILGTPGYMAPEQARGDVVTSAADIFGLGCILFELFYGQCAFDGETPAARFAAVLESMPAGDPARAGEDTELARLIERCLAKDPHERPESAAEIAQALRQPAPGSAAVTAPPADALRIDRRRFAEALGGVVIGGVFGSGIAQLAESQLRRIESLGVLTLVELSESGELQSDRPLVGSSGMDMGAQLSGLLVHELSQLSDIKVPKYYPMQATTPEEFRTAGERLEVNALVTGTFRNVPATAVSDPYTKVDLQIVSASSGKLLWTEQVQTESGPNLLYKKKLAGRIAQAIGRKLQLTYANGEAPQGDSYSCLIKGRTLADPDNEEQLKLALKCFQHATGEDPNFAEPAAGLALTSITLAAQSPDDEAAQLVSESRVATANALRLSDGMSRDARLAEAMIDWQVLWNFESARRTLHELSMRDGSHWQIRHQYGSLLMVCGYQNEGIDELRLATKLHPMSNVLSTDLARARWYQGDADLAVLQAEVIRDKHDPTDLARGLLIDIHEYRGDYESAAAEHDDFVWDRSRGPAGYFVERVNRLEEMPYGPFGQTLNATIFSERRFRLAGNQHEDWYKRRLAELMDAPSPLLLPLLLARHPSFVKMAKLPQAASALPQTAAPTVA